MITLRDGGSFSIDALVAKVEGLGGSMVLGPITVVLTEHNKPDSLDYWIRTNGAHRKDQMQAETQVVDQLVATGRFDRVKMNCPSTGHRCTGLSVISKPRAEHTQASTITVPDCEEMEAAAWLVDRFKAASPNLAYANLNAAGSYRGWVADFKIPLLDGRSLSLDLRKEKDLFLLFVLAVVWSRTGPWENAVYFVAWMKLAHKDTPALWKNNAFVEVECSNREVSMAQTLGQCLAPETRKQVSFRKDVYASVGILAQHWDSIKREIDIMITTRQYADFFDYMRSLKGLGTSQKSMLIKIPLIMRELRCQLYPSIPGEFCCVPDARVYEALSAMSRDHNKHINLMHHAGSVKKLIDASAKIYQLFGDLYDLPLFAYVDLDLPGK